MEGKGDGEAGSPQLGTQVPHPFTTSDNKCLPNAPLLP